MSWYGLIRIIKIVKLDSTYMFYVDPNKSVESLKSLKEYYKSENDTEIILNVKLNPLMLCNCYDRFKIRTTKKFIEIDFSDSNAFIKLDIIDSSINLKTITRTETQLKKQQSQPQTHPQTPQIKKYNKVNKYTNTRKKFVSDLIGICKK